MGDLFEHGINLEAPRRLRFSKSAQLRGQVQRLVPDTKRGARHLQTRGRSHFAAKQPGTPARIAAFGAACSRSRYSDGETPTMSRKVRLKVPRLRKPTSIEIPVTSSSVSRSMRIARSIRRRW